MTQALTSVPARLYPLRPHPEQQRYQHCLTRFNVIPAGRRSGKTELAKRKLLRAAMLAGPDARFFAAAPTRDQAKRIFWADLKAMVRPDLCSQTPSETELSIKLIHGPEIWVIGMDKPQRMEGTPWDGGILDEFANMKPEAWGENVRPALSDRRGWCDLIGVPEGRNHYYDLAQYARSGVDPEWGFYTWFSSDILPKAEVESARRSLDPLVFQQEYEGSFISFEGRAYYNFLSLTHCKPLKYTDRNTLILCFDFNVDPGVCVIAQEQQMPGTEIVGTGVIGEVYIPRNSNTEAVCRKVAADWGQHKGRVITYGDATGGARKTSATAGSDWDIIRRDLRGAFPNTHVEHRVKSANPPERARLNAMNTRCLNGAKEIHLMVDEARAPRTVRDLEGVALLKGGSGEIDKKINLELTHLTDALGYYIESEFPVAEAGLQRMRLGGI